MAMEKAVSRKPTEKILLNDIAPKTSEYELKDGCVHSKVLRFTTPSRMERIVMMTILINRFPGTLRVNRMKVMIRPRTVNKVSAFVKSPRATIVSEEETMMPLCLNPININRIPIPTVIPTFKE